MKDINITQAFEYPFLRKNLKNTLLLCIVGLAVAAWWDSVQIANVWEGRSSLESVDFWVICGVLFVLLPCFLGYGWQLIDIWQTKGLDAAMPDWALERIGTSWWNGSRLVAALGIIGFILMLPDSFAPFQKHISGYSLLNSPRAMADPIAPLTPEERAEVARLGNVPDYAPPVHQSESYRSGQPSWLYLRFCLLLIISPILWQGVVQSARTRDLYVLMAILKSWWFGCKFYLESLLVSVFLTLLFLAYGGLMGILEYKGWVEYLLGPAFIVVTIASFHLNAQVFINGSSANTQAGSTSSGGSG